MADKACFHLSLIGSFPLSISLSLSKKKGSFLSLFVLVSLLILLMFDDTLFKCDPEEKKKVFCGIFLGKIFVVLFCFVLL